MKLAPADASALDVSSTIKTGVNDTPVFVIPDDATTICASIDRTNLAVGDEVFVKLWISYHDGTKWDFLMGFGTVGEVNQSSLSSVWRKMKPASKFQRKVYLTIDSKKDFNSAVKIEYW